LVLYEQSSLGLFQAGQADRNPNFESFSGSFRDECQNVNWFISLKDEKNKIETWKNDYNEYRPQGGLANLTPTEFATAARAVGT
jgi:putative transposase